MVVVSLSFVVTGVSSELLDFSVGISSQAVIKEKMKNASIIVKRFTCFPPKISKTSIHRVANRMWKIQRSIFFIRLFRFEEVYYEHMANYLFIIFWAARHS